VIGVKAIRVVNAQSNSESISLTRPDSYGPDVSEGIIAEALYPYPEGVVVATKGGLGATGPDQWVQNGSRNI